MELRYLDPRLLEADPGGIRLEPGDVAGLAATIAEQGVLQPLGVVALPNGSYRVVYGSRRRAAAIQLGLEQVPCLVFQADNDALLIRQLIENLQRQDLNDMEQAQAFARLREQIVNVRGKQPEGELDEAVGLQVGLTGRTVRRYLGLLDLAEEVQELIRRGELNVTQAQHLRRISSPKTQIELAKAAAEEGMSAAEISNLATYFAANPNLTLETALAALQQGLELRTEAANNAPGGGPLSKTSATAMEPLERDSDYWPDEGDEPPPADDPLGILDETLENQPKNKARVFRIRSLDQMVDETDRLSRAYAEGDLVKWVQSDESAPFKLRLLLKQLRSLTEGLNTLAKEQGWATEE